MIKLSQTWFYALHAVIYVAKQKNTLVKIRDIAQKEDISESLLRRIIAELEKSWIIKTLRGRSWGITLGKDPSHISVYEILESVWEELGIRDCTKGLYCADKSKCTTTDVLTNIQRGFNSLLKMNTLDKFM